MMRRTAGCDRGGGGAVWRWLVLLLLAAGLMLLLWPHRVRPVAAAEEAARRPETPQLQDPDRACAACHGAIVESFKKTAKAQGSGLASTSLLPGDYHDGPSDVSYSVFLRDGAGWMSFTRREPRRELSGERQLELYVGSGRRGRTYLYHVDDLWYELPINFYTRTARWEMAPNMGGRTMPAALPVDANCLHCHASAVQAPLATARNRFPSLPFLQAGIGCAACHGDASAHLASHGKAPVLNPATLSPTRRDSICLQCHLEGDAVVYRAGRSLAQFRPGDDLAEDAVYFVRASAQAQGMRATSQYEALLRSACRRATGDRLTCTTCHDPHSSPSPTERVAYFRAKCLSCHTSPAMATQHHPEQQDCASCHMPTRATTDISHEQVTDHDIEARPTTAASSMRLLRVAEEDLLEPVGGAHAGDRETGLAYAQMAHRGDRSAGVRARTLLRQAEAEGARDAEVQVELGYLEQAGAGSTPEATPAGSLAAPRTGRMSAGNRADALAQYMAALQEDPWQPTALSNLVVLYVQSGDMAHALPLLQRLVGADPGQTAAGLNLAYLACSLGKAAEARRLAESLARINPDDPQLREFLQTGRYQGGSCPAVTEAAGGLIPRVGSSQR